MPFFWHHQVPKSCYSNFSSVRKKSGCSNFVASRISPLNFGSTKYFNKDSDWLSFSGFVGSALSCAYSQIFERFKGCRCLRLVVKKDSAERPSLTQYFDLIGCLCLGDRTDSCLSFDMTCCFHQRPFFCHEIMAHCLFESWPFRASHLGNGQYSLVLSFSFFLNFFFTHLDFFCQAG